MINRKLWRYAMTHEMIEQYGVVAIEIKVL